MSSKSKSGNTLTGFLNLPAELRNNIYEKRVLSRSKAGKRMKLSVTDFRVRHRQLMSLILANKQIANEMLPILFGDNLLHLVDRRSRCSERPTSIFADGSSLEDNDRRIMVHYSASECPCCPNDCAHHALGGRKIELPPHKWRHMFKSVKLKLRAPERPRTLAQVFRPEMDPLLRPPEDRHMWCHADADWLLSLRELKAFGFSNLHFLEIEVRPNEFRPTYDELRTLKVWLEEKIKRMKIDAMEVKVSLKSVGRSERTLVHLTLSHGSV